MNKARRKEIEAIRAEVQALMERVETVHGEEEEYLENMPENMQAGEKAQAAESAIDQLDMARDGLEEVVTMLDEAVA